MPMHQKITPTQKDCLPVMNENGKSEVVPSAKTLALILQLAHSYHVEKKLSHTSLREMVLN